MKAIINLSTGRYVKGAQRLRNSFNDPDIDLYTWDREYKIGSPPHRENPYAFKIYAFEKAWELGYEQVLWLDASIYPVKPMFPYFNLLDEQGYVFEEAGHWAGT